MPLHHGMNAISGMGAYCKRSHEHAREDRFGRMFPSLSPAYVTASVLSAIGAKNGPMDGKSKKSRTKTVPVGQVIFGQFIDHDITLDVTSGLGRVNTPETTPNVRTPTLDLDCIYGAGPEAHPYLYRSGSGDPFSGVTLLTGADQAPSDPTVSKDLYRSPAPHSRAIIGDPRNDENRIVSQLQLGMIRFHNRVAAELRAGSGNTLSGSHLFEEARRRATWHYQWAVVNDFLVDMCGGAVVNDILACGRQFYCPSVPFIPIEFAVAAYRFGHSMVPMAIKVQSGGADEEFFGPVLGEGFSPLADPKAVVDWTHLFSTPAGGTVQKAEKLDTTMAGDLLELPFIDPGPDVVRSLATRNLLRGNSFLLPGGDKVAAAMGRDEDEIEDVMKKIRHLSGDAITEGAPLWLYILAEAGEIGRETEPGKFDKGEGLGPVGARIVAEVLIGLLELDEHSYLGADRNWTPDPDYDTIGKILSASSPFVP